MSARTGEDFDQSNSEITKTHELMYELRVAEIMTCPVVTVTPQSAMSGAKEIMRSRRVSGLPVAVGDNLVGIVSVEDVIRWLESGAPDAPVSMWMTEKVVFVKSNEPAVQAINKFRTYHVGRLPVMDLHDRLVGIVTPGDVISRVLRVLDVLYREAEPRDKRGHPLVDDLASDQTTLVLRFAIAPMDFDRTGIAATRIKRLLDTLHVEPQTVRRAGIAVYEAEMNLTIHATRGGTVVATIESERLDIEVSDDGPGIVDVEQALVAGFSTAPDWIRDLGFGAGMGLTNIKNCADWFSLKSKPGVGTVLSIRFDLGESKLCGLRT